MLKLLEDYDVDSAIVFGTGEKLAYEFSNPHPAKSFGSTKYFVLMSDDKPVVAARVTLSERDGRQIAIIKHILTDYHQRRRGYSTRMTEMLNDWAQARGYELQSDWELSRERLPFWQKQVAKGRAVMTNPDDPSETAYRLTVPPGTNLDGIWQPWSPPWGRR